PAELNLVLVDFKGGATFLGLERAPHTSAIITNLEQELEMVDRMKDALSGELNRRQELLRAAGNLANVTEYERARAGGAPLAPLPALFVVVDEFSELLSQKPDFAELFVAIGRLGRSLHIHLLLASQRLEEGKLRGLDSHLSYRIGLKTFSANESRSVLGVPDAYHLPSVPGSAYLKCDAGDPVRFTTCYVSGPYRPPSAAGGTESRTRLPSAARTLVFTALPVARSAADPAPVDAGGSLLDQAAALLAEVPPGVDDPPVAGVPTLLQTLVDRIAGWGPPAHEVWLPPLAESPTVDTLVGDRDFGAPAAPGDLRVPIGVVDRPFEQRRDIHVLDLAGAAGNIAIVGGPQSGKSTAVRTLICAAAVTHPPEQIQFYCLDFGGGSLTGIAGLPHVGSVAGRADMDAVRRTVAEVLAVIRAREERFTRAGIESMADYRRRRRVWHETGVPAAADAFADDRHGDVFLVLDGVAVLRGELELLDDQINTIAAQGLSYGVHLVVTAARWGEIRPALRDLIGSRVELRLGDAMDSDIGRRAAALVPAGRPGRGLAPDGMHLLIGLPRLDGDPSPGTLPAAAAQAVDVLVGAYGDRRAVPVRKLGTSITTAEVADLVAAQGGVLAAQQVAIGVGELELAPVILDFRAQPHLLAFADVEHGKTTLLRTIVTGLIGTGTPEEVKIVLVDYRRTLLGVVGGDHLAGYASSGENAATMMTQLAAYLTDRLPPEDLTVEQLRDGSWWSGPHVYVIVDDYDMVATATGNPLLPLVDLAAHGRDIGMHLILARRSGGLGRALFDPLIARCKDLSCDILLMSGDRDEGYISGRTRMQRLIPGRGELLSRTRPQEMIQVAATAAG
ncbi:MAG: type VII secretion protein EccCb, partial [Gordonia sp. (in: high G+C Gram-positive bacteria)]